jgi:asparagine synthase (glutamine-hydrolysing)
MCGLTGFFNATRNQTADEMQSVIHRMTQTLYHRGPDDAGSWCDPDSGIAFGFRRLAIVDLSPSGHQPMSSSCGRFVIVFNGEIFNHEELRDELIAHGRSFRGRSDTEVLIEGVAQWGIEQTIQRSIGMFAIAVWDTHQQALTLIRDRLGKKPLSYGRFGKTLLFGSELKALRAHPAFVPHIDRVSIGEFLRQSYLSDRSIDQSVKPLPPGRMLTIRLDDETFWSGTEPCLEKSYWDFQHVVASRLSHPFTGTYDEAVERLDELLTDAVRRRMVADVPLGAFLSGGIDSSLVVALMQKQSPRPVKTFTIGFEEKAYNEAPFASEVARHLKTEHTERIVTAAEAMDVIPLLPRLYDEPFADSSQIPTYLVSKLARQHVTVALSGDGGDELFCGYRRYFEGLDGYFSLGDPGGRDSSSRIFALIHTMPPSIRRALARICRTTGNLPLGRFARILNRAANIFGETGPNDRYLRNLSHWQDLSVVKGLPRSGGLQPPPLPVTNSTPKDFQQSWQSYDTTNYLPGDILTKVDRASMGVSLEARTPLLDHRVVEFAWSLPHEFKVQGRSGKRILRDVLARYVPRDLFERPKVGFGIPIGPWLRGPLQSWAEALIDERRLRQEGFLNPKPIREKWSEHLRGRSDWSYLLWDILMFQSWLSEYPAPQDS